MRPWPGATGRDFVAADAGQAAEPPHFVRLSLGVLPSCVFRNGDRVLRAPTDGYLPPALLERLRGGGLEVLADDQDLSAGVEVHEIPGDHPGVSYVADHAALGVQSRSVIGALEQPDLLRAHGDPGAVALEEIRCADEPGNEVIGGLLVDLRRERDLLDAPVVED